MENGGVIQSISRQLQKAKRKIQNTIRTPSLQKTTCTALAFVILVHVYYNYKTTEVDLSVDNDVTKNKFGNHFTEEHKLDNKLTENKLKNQFSAHTVVTKKTNRPHIILMVADDLGYNDVSYHGSEINTPNIDLLAKTGVRLENYYVQPEGTATRSQLLSGRYQIHTGLQHDVIWPAEPRGLPLDSPIIADKLKEVGYATHMVGKWNLGFFKKEYTPTYRGFDSFFGFLNGHQDYYTHRTKFEQWSGYDLLENEKPADVEKYNGIYSTHLFTGKVIDILNTHNKTKPLFLYIPFQAPHTPLQVPDSYVKPYEGSIPDLKRRTYAGLVSCMDEAVGNITKALKVLGYMSNSLLIFTTDNGANEKDGGSNKPLRGGKSQYFEGGIRAVGFVYSKWLESTMAGTVSTDLIHVTDWFPTILNIAKGGTQGTRPLDGFDQWLTITKRASNKRDEILINIDPLSVAEGQPLFNNTFDRRISAALRVDDWKIMTGYPVNGSRSKNWNETYRDGAQNVWLFNIRRDPNEMRDVSDKYPDIVQIMLGRLEHYQ
ncbi:arylsulfatase J-like [Mercenaria mercenaria]|uniref:arylsulfatase J-like n=1 Tax=Mercenaria mercenaria TaxID=6596 RepID=UPI00234EA0E1|nr:arylsulfatase J-like [Mercenaria mercenaria]